MAIFSEGIDTPWHGTTTLPLQELITTYSRAGHLGKDKTTPALRVKSWERRFEVSAAPEAGLVAGPLREFDLPEGL